MHLPYGRMMAWLDTCYANNPNLWVMKCNGKIYYQMWWALITWFHLKEKKKTYFRILNKCDPRRFKYLNVFGFQFVDCLERIGSCVFVKRDGWVGRGSLEISKAHQASLSPFLPPSLPVPLLLPLLLPLPLSLSLSSGEQDVSSHDLLQPFLLACQHAAMVSTTMVHGLTLWNCKTAIKCFLS